MRTTLSHAFLGLFAILFLSVSAQAQGLAERRAAKNYEDTIFPQLKSEIVAGAGFEVPVRVEWDKLAVVGKSELYASEDFWTKIHFKPLAEALKGITKDEMGKTALKGKLKEIVITFDEATAPSSNYAQGVSFKDGVLSINFKPWSNADDGKERASAIQSVVEAAL